MSINVTKLYANVTFPKCIHRWDAPETCPSCNALYKQKCIEVAESRVYALERMNAQQVRSYRVLDEANRLRHIEIAALEAENARLRAALEKIGGGHYPWPDEEYADSPHDPTPDERERELIWGQQAARAALAGEGK